MFQPQLHPMKENMKKIFKCQGYASFNNGAWHPIDKSTQWVWMEEPESLIVDYISFTDFEATYNYSRIPHPASYCVDTSVFGHPVIWYKGDGYPYKKLNKKNFKPFEEKWQLEEITEFTFLQVMNRMDADSFIEYCKDNGLSICPMNTN